LIPTVRWIGFAVVALTVPVPAQTTIRVTAGLGGAEPDFVSENPHLSGDGRWVAFISGASNLVPNDTLGFDAFLYDVATASLELVSVRLPGGPHRGWVADATVSDDGNLVAFRSNAEDLVPGDTAIADVYVRNRALGTTTRITAGWDGDAWDPWITPDGRYVFFASDGENIVPSAPGIKDVFRYELATGQFVLVSQSTAGAFGNSDSLHPRPSADGNVVAFGSEATNLVPGDTNDRFDGFVRDISAGTTQRFTVDWLGNQLGEDSLLRSMSRDGRYVCYDSRADGITPDDLPGTYYDALIYDRMRSTVVRASSPGTATAPDPRVADLGNLSGDGRFAAFRSNLGDLVTPDPTPGLADVFLKDLHTGSVEIVSLSSTGSAAPEPSWPSVSNDGRYVAFITRFALVPGDVTTGLPEIYVRDRGPVLYTTPCSGDGSSAPCPCANLGSQGHGCENVGLTGGVLLSATGSASLANDTLRLELRGFFAQSTPIAFVQGDALLNGGVGATFGDGVHCVGGTTVRFGRRRASGGTSAYGAGVAGDAPVSVAGQVVVAGSTRYYQCTYFNHGSFCGQLRRNWSNSIAIVWGA
jgi:Tol biopolymer transport system component